MRKGEASARTKEGSRRAGAADSVPLRGGCVIAGLFGQCARLSSVGAIENADRLGFELDSDSLIDVVDRFLPGWNRDSAVILASREFALTKMWVPLTRRDAIWAEALSKCNNTVPLRFVFSFAFLVLP